MYRRGTYRIVDVQLMIYKLNGIDQHQSTNQSDDHGT